MFALFLVLLACPPGFVLCPHNNGKIGNLPIFITIFLAHLTPFFISNTFAKKNFVPLTGEHAKRYTGIEEKIRKAGICN